MAKIIRFPLKMKNGIEVRTIEELRENFDMDAVLENYTAENWIHGSEGAIMIILPMQ